MNFWGILAAFGMAAAMELPILCRQRLYGEIAAFLALWLPGLALSLALAAGVEPESLVSLMTKGAVYMERALMRL